MLLSREVRWFYPGKLPEDIEQWYMQGGNPEETERTDQYLCGSGGTLGIKLRQGFIEVKQRSQTHGEVQFSPMVSGLVEDWIKWTFTVGENTGTLQDLERQWVPVRKKRWLKLFVFDNGIRQVPLQLYPETGCTWELSRVDIPGAAQSWWSMCFELFGTMPGSPERLEQMVAYAAAPIAELGIKLMANASFGYPVWLEQINK